MSKKEKNKLISEESWEKGKARLSTTFILSSFVLLILVIALIMASGIVLLIQHLQGEEVVIDIKLTLLMVIGISAIMGYGFSVLLGSTVLMKPINALVNGMNRLAGGDFSARLELKGIFKNIEIAKEITTSFNRMAEELGNTELLRSDFVNNFSHEFKTPIVSIAGFADLLKNEDLPEEDRRHYLSIITTESRRLASLATNILNLTKIENQTILTGVSEFNLSEQLRSVVLLLESKWAFKGVIPMLDIDEEIEISANEQLLKEVWLNLLDNAIKFSPECGEIGISIEQSISRITVHISNEGEPIPDDVKEKIFTKFYQADVSHSGEGSGVGLAVVKRVVELHRGAVSVRSADGRNVFSVSLPVRKKSQAQRSAKA
ncbi:MAG: HAMP domain-containing histidine kinase [Clostridia bacterium]|nr:HAMP domain-containing histidine kinase [Clostridia bacterium]